MYLPGRFPPSETRSPNLYSGIGQSAQHRRPNGSRRLRGSGFKTDAGQGAVVMLAEAGETVGKVFECRQARHVEGRCAGLECRAYVAFLGLIDWRAPHEV
jgi:hypothetical protein